MPSPDPGAMPAPTVSRRPPMPLALFVDRIWHACRPALPHRRERSLPTGRVDIVIPLLQPGILRFDDVAAPQARLLRGAIVSGVHDRLAIRGMDGPSCVIGVHFLPGGAAAFFGGALAGLRNRTELLEDLWGPEVRGLRERLQAAPTAASRVAILEAAMLARLPAGQAPDPVVNAAVRAFGQDPAGARVDAVMRASGCSAGRFIQRFDAAVGITPKRYARVLRLRTLLDRIAVAGPRDWAALALDAGFADQAHLANEFRRMTGLAPTAYRPLHRSQPTHVPIVDGR